MAKKKRRYFIKVPAAIKFLSDAYGLNAYEVNYYHMKIRDPEFQGVFDWYHTQGTVVVSTEQYAANIGSAGTDEDVALLIRKYISTKHE